jgi:hypothetical protein
VADHDPLENALRFLIPRPRELEPARGAFPWPDTLTFEVWGEIAPRMRLHLAQFGQDLQQETGVSVGEASLEEEAEPPLQIFLDPLVPPGFREGDFPEAGDDKREDSYLLAVGERLTLWAGGESALFYGLETLLQLFRSAGETRSLPGLVIRDVPAFAHRMVQYDIAREQTVRMEYLKQVIRRLASLKVNQVMLYLEYRYRWKKHPLIGPPRTLTAEQAEELTEFAASYCVDLVPQVNVLGHVEGFLRHDQYAHLREDPDNPFQLCPSNPASFDLFKELIEEMLPHFDSEFFHVGGDESFLLGKCPRCQEKVKSDGIAALYADHMLKFHDLLTSRGKRMMMWGDIILQHRDIADRLPKDIIIFDWHYHDTSPDTLDFFTGLGFDVYAASSLGGYETNRLLPAWDRLDQNTGPFFRDAATRSLFGACFTTWEMFFGNFFQNNWYPVIYGAAAAWNPDEPSEGGLADRFGEAFTADPANACVEILRIISGELLATWGGFAGESSAQRIRAVLFDPDPLLLPRMVADEITDQQLARADEAITRAARLLAAARLEEAGKRTPDLLEWLEFPLQMYRSVCLRIRAVRELRDSYAEALEVAQERPEEGRKALGSCVEVLLRLKKDLEYYLTNQPLAVERYGSSLHDLERYQRQVETLDDYLARFLALLKGPSQAGLPSKSEMGLE